MSNQNAKPDLPLANCFSETPKRVTKFTHLWTIENFRFHSKDKKIKSPPFSASPNDGTQWQLRLHPDGSDEASKGYVSLYLKMISCEASEASARFKFSVLNGKHEAKATIQAREPHIFKLTSEGWGWNRLMERKEVLIGTKFPGDTLIVRIEIWYAVEVGPTAPSLSSFFPPGMPEHNPSADFRELLESGKFADVMFDVNGREFRAHKAVLATRSPTFKTLFERNPESTRPTRLKIRDADDHTFSELLNLVYTGETNESYPQIRSLLSAIAAQGQATSEVDSSDGEEEEEDTGVPDETHTQEIKGSLSSKSSDNSTASAVSVLESIKTLIASTDTLGLSSSTEELSLEGDPTKSAGKSRPGTGLTPSAALSAPTLCSQLEESSTLESGKESTAKIEKPEDKPLLEDTDLIQNSESNEDLQKYQLQDSSNGAAERVPRHAPVVGVRQFNGDKNTFFDWWREFRAQVHGQNLCLSEKLIYLLLVLDGEAKECINSSSSEGMSYYATLDSLFLRYGNIEALPPGMFALLIARRLIRLAPLLRIVDSDMLMEQIEKIHGVVDASRTPKGEDSVPLSASSCQCRESNSNTPHRSSPMQMDKPWCCAVPIEQQVEKLERLFAETRSPDSSTRGRLAREIGMTDKTIQMWFQLRPIDWRKALHPHWQLGNVVALCNRRIPKRMILSDAVFYVVWLISVFFLIAACVLLRITSTTPRHFLE